MPKPNLNQVNRWLAVVSFVAVLLLASVYFYWLARSPSLSNQPQALLAVPRLSAVACPFKPPLEMHIDCYGYTTADGLFELAVTVIRDQSPEPAADALVYLAGGPGNETGTRDAEAMEYWYYWLAEAGINRDLVLVDQRGTGASIPQWRCDDYGLTVAQVIGEPLSLAGEYKAFFSAIDRCLRQGPANIDAAAYGTLLSAQDMAGILPALGYEQWNVLGSSYGSRLALVWALRWPAGVRSLILDSVYPLSKRDPAGRGALFEESFVRLQEYCRQQQCKLPSTEILPRLELSLQQLASEPLVLNLRLLGANRSVVLTDFRFFNSLRSALYQPKHYQDIVTAIVDVSNRSTIDNALVRIVGRSLRDELAEGFNPLTYFLVHCRETERVNENDLQKRLSDLNFVAQYFAQDAEYDFCQLVETAAADDFSDWSVAGLTIPSLLVAGNFDPVTPVTWARELNSELANSQLWIDNRGGHGVSSQNSCVLSHFATFLSQPDKPQRPACLVDDTQNKNGL